MAVFKVVKNFPFLEFDKEGREKSRQLARVGDEVELDSEHEYTQDHLEAGSIVPLEEAKAEEKAPEQTEPPKTEPDKTGK